MSQEAGLYGEFAKAFARKIAYVLAWVAIVTVAALITFGGMYVLNEIASFLLSATRIANSERNLLMMNIGLLVWVAGLVKIAHSAWVEAKTVTEGN